MDDFGDLFEYVTYGNYASYGPYIALYFHPYFTYNGNVIQDYAIKKKLNNNYDLSKHLNEYLGLNPLPIDYSPYFEKKVINMLIPEPKEGSFEKFKTFLANVHETHHFLNINSCTMELFNHLNRWKLLCHFFIVFYQESNSYNYSTPVYKYNFNKNETNSLLFKKYCVNEYFNGITLFRGNHKFDFNKFTLKYNSVELFQEWYKVYDAYNKTNYSRFLLGISKETKPFVIYDNNLRDRQGSPISYELGYYQLYECLAKMCEYVFVQFNQEFILQIFNGDHDFLSEFNKSYYNFRDSENIELTRIYQIPLRLVFSAYLKCKNKVIDKYSTLFIITIVFCWISLMPPVTPNTVHLIEEYSLQWEDLHPGMRFQKLINILDDVIEYFTECNYSSIRYNLNDIYLYVIKKLVKRWPTFEEITSPIDIKTIYKGFDTFNHNDDVYFNIYNLINSERNKIPGCDIFPGKEFFNESKLYIPVVAYEKKIVVSRHPDYSKGLKYFYLNTILDLVIFGTKTKVTNLLFNSIDFSIKKLSEHYPFFESELITKLYQSCTKGF